VKNLVSSFRANAGWIRPNGDCSLGFAHGTAGIACALAVGGGIAKLLEREDLMANARSLIDQTVRRALKTVYYRFGPEVGENYCFQPSLFRGLAGIGYTLIRSMSPLDLPCILTFE